MVLVIRGLRSRALLTRGFGPGGGPAGTDNRNAAGVNSQNRPAVGTDGQNRAVGGRPPNT